jgi:hypothetical protein
MKEYIEREYLENMVYYHLCKSNGAEHYAYGVIRGELKTAPIADVVEVKHGRWHLADDGDGVVCSECGEDFCNIYLEVDRFKYCPNCGAKMEA